MKKQLGQFFTVSEKLQQFVYETVKNKDGAILEPSFGAGHLIQKFMERKPMECYEIDESIKPIVKFGTCQKVYYSDFLSSDISMKFKTIVGNPPYVKNKNGNLFIQFIEKCYHLLDDTNGEMVFIVPSDFIKMTRASNVINEMTRNGTFTHFWFPNDEHLFDNASIDVVVFRYQKGHITNKTILNGQENEYNVTKGIITFGNNKGQLVSELFDVYVGMVSGKDDVFKQEFGNIEMLTDKNKIEKFVCVSSFPCGEKCIDDHLKMNKDDLLKRKIKKFNENNWFEWGALRNKERTEKNAGKKCIYIKTVTRSNEVAFQDIVQYFGGTLICMIPKKNDVHLNTVVEFLNSETFRKEYMYSGRFKIGQKQLMCLRIPE